MVRAHQGWLWPDYVELEPLINRYLVSPGTSNLVLPLWKIFEQVDIPTLFASGVERAVIDKERQYVN